MNTIQLKGRSDALRCVVPEEIPQRELRDSFRGLLAGARHVLQHANVVIDFQGRPIDMDTMAWIVDNFVVPGNMRVLSWNSFHMGTQEKFRAAGVPFGEPDRHNVRRPARGIVLRRSLRSGQRVEHGGDVMLCGNINRGAEIISSGHVVVLGRLQGLVHAGVDGDSDATITTVNFEALQVRIGNRVGSMDKDTPWWGKPVFISVESDNSVTVEEWSMETDFRKPGLTGLTHREEFS